MDEVAWMYEQDPARMKPIEESHGEFVSPISEELLKEIWDYIQDGNNMVGDTPVSYTHLTLPTNREV